MHLNAQIESTVAWLSEWRERLRPQSVSIAEADKEYLAAYFRETTIDHVTYAVDEEMPNPPAFEAMAREGGAMPLNLSANANGIPFIDTILISRRSSEHDAWRRQCLFHEMVHIVQFDQLGLDRWAELYVSGSAAFGYRYMKNPMELDCQVLEHQYYANGILISVEEFIRSRVQHYEAHVDGPIETTPWK